jgi:hypothetical protein
MSILSEIRQAFAPRDPLRFSHLGTPIPGWHGEFAGMPRAARSRIEDRVIIDRDTGRVEFNEQGMSHVDVPPELTAWEREMIAGKWWGGKKKYDPNNVLYSKAKAVFAKNPQISRAELSERSGVNMETLKDIHAIFNCAFETLLAKQKINS